MGTTYQLCNFHVAQAEETPHQQLSPHGNGKLFQTVLEGASLCNAVFVHRLVRLSSKPIQYIEVVNGTGVAGPPQLIEATMVGDPAQPAPKSAESLEPVDPLKCLEKHLLTDVAGKLAVADNPEGERGKGGAIGAH